PFVLEEIVEIQIAPAGRRLRPRTLETARDGGGAVTVFERVAPTAILFFNAGTGRTKADVLLGICGTVRFAEGMAAGDQRDRLFVVHRHARKRLPDVSSGSNRIRIAVRTFGIDV